MGIKLEATIGEIRPMNKIITLNPKNDAPLAEYAWHSDKELETALATAWATYGLWRRKPLAERLSRLAVVADKLTAAAPRLAELATREMGKPLAQAVSEVEKCALA